jgi:eukaryotic-like serine/threonine-protein kinase
MSYYQEQPNLNMKKFSLISLLLLGAFVLSACSGQAAVNTWPGLSADAQHAYLSNGSFVYAVDLQTGKEAWRYPEDADSKHLYFATPVLTEDGQLLIGSEGTNHALVSINPETGKDNWSEPFADAKGKWVAPPLVLNEKIYAPNTDGFIYVLDMKGKAAADPIEIGGLLWSTPSTDGNVLYVASLDHHLHIIDPATNQISEPIDIGGAVPSSPLVTTDGAYVGSFASNVQFVTLNGKSEVIAEASNWVWGAPVLDGETLYYADLDGNVFSFDTVSRKQNWSNIKPDGPIVASPLVIGDQIYIATEAGTFFALDKDAKVVWDKDPGGEKGNIYTTPVAAGDLILVAPYKGDFLLAAYDAAGKQAWTFTPEN